MPHLAMNCDPGGRHVSTFTCQLACYQSNPVQTLRAQHFLPLLHDLNDNIPIPARLSFLLTEGATFGARF